jgi:hypothetical protein
VAVSRQCDGPMLGGRRSAVAAGGSVIKYKSPLNVLKDTYNHSCY